ncbi:subunit of histone deacetylase complex [Chloropicon primus]|uniref:Subunit of histone deacetylase complex n=1 Tax=Chloropicon primus TaxID=1764295 RepID=A0A5B8MMH3_9CHLO|nr:subunit of histone deacetylase complex [Chloropicon primus]UPR00448.1 subunit of histone deacetylase complex [Chloropicon primus]|mmetsp:Transcript_1299/g.3770  ORF Transcript_1299/g.3770 Transcript_1299/m.3770 type:complete len:204 (+) Transcript_1299:635-1246(+)|eukprot:QDZ21234.1 subunit of histone deacetylase complex [Chloropicon primus]
MNGGGSRAAAEDDEVSEDSTALLPRHTKVLVTGNNRTKSKLVGLKGTVKKAVGLGGWHWLVLSDGSHVRLQRNALTVLEQPTGEESESEEDENEARTGGEERTTFSVTAVGGRTKRKPSRYATTSSLRRQDDQSPDVSVNFNKLEVAALKRYKKHYKLKVQANATKEQLVSAVGAHFVKQKVDERKVVHTFLEFMISKRVKTN